MPYADRKVGEQARAARRAAAGLCRNCPAKAIPGESRCQTCKERRRKQMTNCWQDSGFTCPQLGM